MQGSLFHTEPGHDGGPARITPKVERPDPADTRSAFEGTGPAVQKANLDRVTNRIGQHILSFLYTVEPDDGTLARLTGGKAQASEKLFQASDLRKSVDAALKAEGQPEAAPGSADRILRDLRKREVIHYSLMSRRNSVYRIEKLPFS